ncbi:hypothetical protein AVEN_162303-1 [Araneus ventricosus]|uniref:Uncharacterized protein n=1 Tax=Araneus ventricosus TaxID=182803 RepID=A0A4Y1ZJJ7_ARAVE|nr:hypothetical protein AVEN_2805-1 [Araneus ventricosus]GBL53071.1 hypothetical protein AVEN_192629-1 [Araneus ventricosus]GBL53088.1 hypothetical protein AVEN_237001-1 [Araneus ventricosus]GBL53274.1 hypothetical protein AVEN_162303-1 [Araneus ventricosus]
MECRRGSLEALWFANLILQFRRKDELQSSTSQRELRIPLPINHRVLVSTPEKFVNSSRRTGNPVHTCDPSARERFARAFAFLRLNVLCCSMTLRPVFSYKKRNGFQKRSGAFEVYVTCA